MSILRGFLPWIAYGVISSFNWQWGALAAFLLSVALILQDRRAGVRADAQILEISAAVFFLALTVVAFTTKNTSIEDFDSSLSFGWLALTAWISLAIGKPFTSGIAKRDVPEEYWGTERFKRANVMITGAWALAFTLTCAAVTVIYLMKLDNTYDIIAQVAGFVIPITFTNWYREKASGQGAAQGA